MTIDLRALDRVLEVDATSRAAPDPGRRHRPGARGPAASQHGLTLRHYPQSFEYSTLGGWIATRAGGHFATLWTHIDDLVESVRAITPSGEWESRRLPGSGRGPEPRPDADRLRGDPRRDHRGVGAGAGSGPSSGPRRAWSSTTSRRAREAARALAQSGLHPSNCRLLDAGEAALTGAAGRRQARVLVLGFESADHPLDAWMAPGAGAAAPTTAAWPASGRRRSRGDAEGSWRDAFLQAPYLRDTMVAAGVLAETFETAITWDRFDEFVPVGAGGRARRAVAARAASTCRLTHVYPDGAAPYFTVLAPARRGAELEQWQEVKDAAGEAIIAAGGTITHHHAVGRDHRPWYDRQRPEPFAAALRAAKRELDPPGILNPGVLIDP